MAESGLIARTTMIPPHQFTNLTFSVIGVLRNAGVRIIHPCAAFAHAAGFDTWQEAVAAMKGGQVLAGPAPQTTGKSTINITIFNTAVAEAGLRAKYFDTGIVAVGLPSAFTNPDQGTMTIDVRKADDGTYQPISGNMRLLAMLRAFGRAVVRDIDTGRDLEVVEIDGELCAAPAGIGAAAPRPPADRKAQPYYRRFAKQRY